MRTDRPETPGAKADLDNPKPGTPEDFRQRIDRLSPGHPSSPVEADGRRKPPPPRLRDIALPEPATDAEHAEHVKDVRDRLDKARAHGLSTDQQHTIDRIREVLVTGSDAALHVAIIRRLYAGVPDVPCERQCDHRGGP